MAPRHVRDGRCATLAAALLLGVATVSGAATSGFVTRDGDQLMVNGAPFRFGGCNIYWLGLDENVPPQTTAYPTEFRQNDALETAAGMGATVVRCHTCGISVGNPLSFEPKLGVFNDTAAQVIDRAVAKAGTLGLRLVVPLVDNWRYYHGGKHTFTDWYGISDENLFYTNKTVIAAFKDYIQHLLTHENHITGLRFVDDPTIMAWETGNELRGPTAWTAEISAFIKSLAPKQLVLDGHATIDPGSFDIDTVDIVSTHYYPMDATRVATDAATAKTGGKPFFAGEFGWSTGNLTQFLDTVLAGSTAGAMYWSLFPHADTHGFVYHGDQFTVHYPGDDATMEFDVQRLRAFAYAMADKKVPSYPTPQTPTITFTNQTALAWRGAAMAVSYTVQQAAAATVRC